jgi:hypothetical protein
MKMHPFTVTDSDGVRCSRWWTQSINDNQRKGGGNGSPWKAGRWILRSNAGSCAREVLAVEWHHRFRLRPDLGLTASVKPHRVQFHFSILGAGSWWVKIGFRRQGWLAKTMIEERLFGVRFGYIGDIAWLYFAFDEESDSCGMVSYYREKKVQGEQLYFGGNRVQLTQGLCLKLRFRLRDRLLGKKKYVKETLQQKDVSIPMDGREYLGTWELTRETWKRPRWPFRSHERVGSWIEVPHPPAFAGKGENSYDCGDDGIFGCGSGSITPAGAVGDYIMRVMKARERYGPASDPDAFSALHKPTAENE